MEMVGHGEGMTVAVGLATKEEAAGIFLNKNSARAKEEGLLMIAEGTEGVIASCNMACVSRALIGF